MSEKELTSFQEQLYRNLLTSALDARIKERYESQNELEAPALED